jgi:hypothetical protein
VATPPSGGEQRPAERPQGEGPFDHAKLLRDLGDQWRETARRDLEQESGADFDRAFVHRTLIDRSRAHDAMNVFRRFASSAVEKVILDGQKLVASHLDQAKELNKHLDRVRPEGGAAK